MRPPEIPTRRPSGKRRYRISQAERLADVARWDLTSTAWKVRAQVRSALVEYLAAKRNVSLLEDEERLGAEQVALLEHRFAVGMMEMVPQDRAKTYADLAKLDTGSAGQRLCFLLQAGDQLRQKPQVRLEKRCRGQRNWLAGNRGSGKERP